MRVLSLIATLLISFSVLSQEEKAHNPDLLLVRDLAEDVRDIVTHSSNKSMHPNAEGNFRLTPEQADRMHSVAELDEEILSLDVYIPDCVETEGDVKIDPMAERVKKRKFKIFFEVRYNSRQHDGAAQGGYGSQQFSDWMAYNHPGSSPSNINALRNSYKRENEDVDFDSLSPIEQQERLRAYANSKYGVDVPDGILIPDLTYDYLRNNPSEWKSTLNSVKNNMTFDQKAKLVARFGGAFGDNYNYDRADGTGEYADGIVSMEELLDSTKGKHPGGVCRDVALAQAQMLKELGVDKSYIVAYKTPGGFHANLITQDPDDPNRVVKMNYGYMTEEQDVTGNVALRQDTTMPDVGLRYRIYDNTGKPVAKLPNEWAQMYHEMTGGENSDPLVDRNYRLTQVGVSGEHWKGRLFVGQTSTGEQIIGAATDMNYGWGDDIFNVDGGLAVSHLSGQRSLVAVDQQNLYGRLKAELNTPYLQKGNFGIRAQTTAEAQVMLSNTTVVKNSTGSTLNDEKAQISFDTDYTVAVQSHWDSDDSKTMVDTEVRAFLYDDHKNVAAGTSGGHGVVLDKTLVRVGVQREMTDDFAFLADTGVVLRGIGDSAFLRTGFVANQGRTRALASVQVPFERDMPRFLPGSTMKAGVGVSQQVGPFDFSLNYDRDFDTDDNQFMMGARLKF